MSSLEITGQLGTKAVLKLREQKLKQGLPFMINAKELATNQCYLEYPNGSIKLIYIIPSTQHIDVVRELTSDEAGRLRSRFRLPVLQ